MPAMVPGQFQLLNVFTGPAARGNPCCVLAVDSLEDSAALQHLAADFNQPATAFVRARDDGGHDIRWFAAERELMLCGHGAAGAGLALTNGDGDCVALHYAGGVLQLAREAGRMALSAPGIPARPAPVPAAVQAGLHGAAIGYFVTGDKDIVLLADAPGVGELVPDWDALATGECFGYSVTAPGIDCDFVSRVLLPRMAQREDQATGSAHLALAPFWAGRLGRAQLHARQLSARGGDLHCRVEGDTVTLLARCDTFAGGQLQG